MINSRKTTDLDPEAQIVCTRHIALCHAEGITLLITSTYRDYECQTALYAQGRTAPGPIVTHAQAGESYHNFKAAYDAIPLMNGKADWTVQDPAFQRMIVLGKQAGAEAGYDWPGELQDSDHFQVRPANIQNIAEAEAAFDGHGTIFV
jgi:peptidoglycan L-alanyl-D-glutamate endopeptidase CwlK